jgi:protein O-mannosyl-transferase
MMHESQPDQAHSPEKPAASDATSSPRIPASKPDTRTRILLLLLIAGIAIAAHFPIVFNHFVSFDDNNYIYNNKMVEQGLNPTTLKWAFTQVVVANYHPVTLLSHLIDGSLFGLNPAGHHAMSLLLHALNAVLLAYVLNRFTGSFYRSVAVAVLFAVHPIHVESVAWASDRKDTLSFAFAMLTLLAYKNWLDGRATSAAFSPQSLTRYVGMLAVYLLALLSKPTVITLPALMLLLDFWPLNRAPAQEPGFRPALKSYLRALPRLIIEKIPVFLLTFVASITVFLVQRSAAAVVEAGGLPIPARLANALFSYIRYLGKLLFPHDLSIMYPHPTWWPAWYIIASALALMAITAILFYLANRLNKHYLPVGWLWFLGVMLPMIGIVQVGAQAMADRYAYITFPGLYILLVWSLSDALSHFKAPKIAAPALLAAAVIPLGIAANFQTRHWQNSQTLFTRAVQVTGTNPMAQCALGNELARLGQYQDAIPHFHAAVEEEPTYADAFASLGTAYLHLRETRLAEQAYEKALALNPNLIEPRLNMGHIYILRDDPATAERIFAKLAQDKPEIPEPYWWMGLIRAKEKKLPQALLLFDQAIARDPTFAEAFNSRGTVKAQMGDIPGAYDDFARAVQLKPSLTDAQENLLKAKDFLQSAPAR